MEALRKIGRYLAPEAQKGDDGRDQWGSRASFVLAAMGGAVGLGNLLRFPGQVFNNNGLQWFVPYLIALACLGIPVLMLEICIGQAYRGGCLIAFDHINKRTKGVGMAVVFNGYAVVIYYVPILAWVMTYFRNSFTSPMPWTGRPEEYYFDSVIRNPEPIESASGMLSYPGTGILGETAGWTAFTWFVVWLCMFKGIGLTGKVVYFTMGLPIVMAIILIGRGASMPNAGRGIKLYFGEWNSDQLAGGPLWQAALGQIFFTIGVGMGYFTSYASYNSKYANAVQDTFIIACTNCLYEVLVAFSVFGVIGFLDLNPGDIELGTFSIGFLTYPEALAAMPGANFWAVVFFFTIMLLGLSSSFALLETIVTMICDTDWGKKFPRTVVSTIMVTASFLLSLMYCTEFGYYLLDAVDTYVNFLCLFFVVYWECVSCTTIYRYQDAIGQVGWPAFLVYHGGYFGGTTLGLIIAHTVHPGGGAGLGFGIFFVCAALSFVIAETPDTRAPRFWGNNGFLNKLWWIAFYQGVQLRRDLNVSVATGNNWKIPVFWGPMLKYISCPILAIIYSFAYGTFRSNQNDPVHIFAFSVAHVIMILITAGFVVPRWFDIFIPAKRRGEGAIGYAPGVTVANPQYMGSGLEAGRGASLSAGTNAMPVSKEMAVDDGPATDSIDGKNETLRA